MLLWYLSVDWMLCTVVLLLFVYCKLRLFDIVLFIYLFEVYVFVMPFTVGFVLICLCWDSLGCLFGLIVACLGFSCWCFTFDD